MRILIIRNHPSYMDVINNTYNIQEVGLAKAMVRRGHVCDIVFWSNKESETSITFDGDKTINIFYRTGINILKTRFLIILKN